MNNILISDPFLFRPSGEDPIVQTYQQVCDHNNNYYYNPQGQNYYSDYYDNYPDDFIEFTKSQFELDWTNTSTSPESSSQVSSLFPSFFPVTTTFSHDHCYSIDPNQNIFDQDVNMEQHLLDMFGANEDSFQEQTEQSSQPLTEGFTGELQHTFDYGDFADILNGEVDLDFFANEQLALEKEKSSGNEGYTPYSLSNAATPYSEDSYSNNMTGVDDNSNNSIQFASSTCVSVSQVSTGVSRMLSMNNENLQNTTTNIGTAVSSRSHARKASHTPRQASASPTYQFDDGSNSSMQEDVKPDINLLSAAVNGSGKRRANNNIKALNVRNGGRVTKAKGKSGPSKSPAEKPKMYEMKDDPKARNALLAFQNREKKKQEREKLIKENAEMNVRIKKHTEDEKALKTRVIFLENQLKETKIKNRAEVGLRGVVNSAKEILETIMPPLINNFGPFQLKTAEWFRNVSIPLDHATCNEMMRYKPTSSYITLNISTTDRLVHVNYNPEIPDFAKKGDSNK